MQMRAAGLAKASAAVDASQAAREDAARFQAIPGIGKKTAERIVLELKGSIAEPITALLRKVPRGQRRASSNVPMNQTVKATPNSVNRMAAHTAS